MGFVLAVFPLKYGFIIVQVHVHVVIDLHDFYFQTESGDNL